MPGGVEEFDQTTTKTAPEEGTETMKKGMDERKEEEAMQEGQETKDTERLVGGKSQTTTNVGKLISTRTGTSRPNFNEDEIIPAAASEMTPAEARSYINNRVKDKNPDHTATPAKIANLLEAILIAKGTSGSRRLIDGTKAAVHLLREAGKVEKGIRP